MNYSSSRNFKRNALAAARDAMAQYRASGACAWVNVARANLAAARRYNWRTVARKRQAREWLA
jgi:hypothetical protein